MTVVVRMQPLAIPLPAGRPAGLLVAMLTALALLAAIWSGLAYENVLTLCALGGLGLIALIALWRWPQAGLAILLVGGVVIPYEIGTGTQTSLNAVFLLAPVLIVIWAFQRLEAGRDPLESARRVTLPLQLFAICCILAFVVGLLPWFDVSAAPWAAQAGALAIFLFSVGIFFVVQDHCRDLVWLRRMTHLFFLAGLLYLLPMAFPVLPRLAQPLDGAIGSLFWTWLVALVFGQACGNRHLRVWMSAGLLLIVALAFYVTAGQGRDWASGWIPPLVAVTVTLLLRFPRTAGLMLVGAGALAAFQFREISDALLTADQQYSLSTRAAALQVLWQIFQANPVTGFGPANYYHYTHVYPILGWYVDFASHNNYVDVVLQTGLLGLGALVWFFSALGRWSLRALRMAGGGFEAGYVLGALGGLAGTLTAAALGDWVLPFVYNVGVKGFPSSILAWVFLGGLAAVLTVIQRQANASQVSEHV